MIKLEPGQEGHFSLKLGSGELHFIMRPMSTLPKEGMIAFLDGRTAKGNPSRRVGTFRDGEWKIPGSAGFEPLTWTACAEMEKSCGG